MNFEKYQHLERLGTEDVQNITLGQCHVFYKIDGTNASVWLGDDGQVKAGSRNREISADSDNAGFWVWVDANRSKFDKFFYQHPTVRLYGEWLVPHSLKTYREDAWREFYVFDVVKEDGEYVEYETYQSTLTEFGINYIPPICSIKNPTMENLQRIQEKSGEFLIADGEGLGEGIVIKNYGFYNKWNRQVWAKLVTNEFKEKHQKEMGAPKHAAGVFIEEAIADKHCTPAFIRKEYAKMVLDSPWQSRRIPELLGRIYHTLIVEESWNFVKENKNPTINFQTLQQMVNINIKAELKEIF